MEALTIYLLKNLKNKLRLIVLRIDFKMMINSSTLGLENIIIKGSIIGTKELLTLSILKFEI